MRHAAPGVAAHTGQGHSDGGVEVTPGHSAAYDQAEEYSDGPPDRELISKGLNNLPERGEIEIKEILGRTEHNGKYDFPERILK